MKFLLIALLGITTAFAQSEPVTRIKGESETSYKISPNLIVPNKQATKLTSTSARIETGNNNLLKNPSFEAGQVDEGWICNGQEVIASSIGVVDGDKSLKFGGSSSGYSCVQDLTVGNKYYGQVIEVGGFVSGERDGRFCYRESGAGVKCFNYTAGSGMKQFRFRTTVDSISTIGISVLKTQAGVGSFYIDGMYLGLPRNNLEKSDLNNLLDGGFENGYGNAEWLVTGSATFDYVVPTSLRTKNNKYALELNFTGSGSVYTIWNRGTDKVSMPAACNGWVQPFSTNVSVEVRASSGDLLGTKKFTSNDLGKWVKFSIPFKTDTTNHYECIIKSEDSNKSYIDDMFFGPFDAEAIVAKFDNTADLGCFPITFRGSTTNPTKPTTNVTDQVCVSRIGSVGVFQYSFYNANTSGQVAGSGAMLIALPIINGNQLTFGKSIKWTGNASMGNAGGSNVGSAILSGNIYGNGNVSPARALAFNNQSFYINGLGSAGGDGHYAGGWSWEANNGFGYTFSATVIVEIEQWSHQTNAAIVACKEGPLKCNNTYTANVSGTTILNSNIPNWIKLVTNPTTGTYVVTFADNLFTVPPTCIGRRRLPDATWSANGDYGAQGLTDATKTTLLSSSNTFNFDFFLTCTKNAPDYNEAYDRIVIKKDDADIRATEWLTGGFDYIDNKPIYKICHKVAADISTDAATVASWGTGLNPIATNFGNSTNEFTVYNNSTSAGYYLLLYNKTTGNVRTALSGGYIVRAGTKFCMEYTR